MECSLTKEMVDDQLAETYSKILILFGKTRLKLVCFYCKKLLTKSTKNKCPDCVIISLTSLKTSDEACLFSRLYLPRIPRCSLLLLVFQKRSAFTHPKKLVVPHAHPTANWPIQIQEKCDFSTTIIMFQ